MVEEERVGIENVERKRQEEKLRGKEAAKRGRDEGKGREVEMGEVMC